MTLFDRTMTMLERVLDIRAARHQVIASNIANEETPGYRAKELPFREMLMAVLHGTPASQLRITHPRHLGGHPSLTSLTAAHLVTAPEGSAGLDANTVSLDRELANLTENTMQYQAAATILAMRFQQVLAAIREAR
ncbi:flagellar basal body rod protein FlgB [Nitrospira sp. Kam-Ns4a]